MPKPSEEEKRLRREIRANLLAGTEIQGKETLIVSLLDKLEKVEDELEQAVSDLGQMNWQLSVVKSRESDLHSREKGSLRADLECLVHETLGSVENEEFLKSFLSLLCKRLGHAPRQDQCGKPEHDYCDACGETLPGAAKR